jgi:DHA3 family tetracycline resistance protein-like MFS transporter
MRRALSVKLFQALRHRPFALLWFGQTASRLGDSLYRVALAWWVLEETGSATAMGTVFIFSFTPMLLFLLVGGLAVDRLPRLRVMLVADLVNGAVMLIVAALAGLQLLEIWHVYAATTVFGLVEAFFFPAYSAAVPELTPPDLLPSANSLTSLSVQLAGVLGPALGAGIVAVGGAASAFGLNGLSFLLAAGAMVLLLRRVPDLAVAGRAAQSPTAPPRETPPRPNPLRDLREGLAIILRSPWLWVTIVVYGLINITLMSPRQVALPFLVEQTMRADVGTLGLIYSAGSVGSVLGSVWLGRRTHIRRRGWLAYGATIVGGGAVMVYGLWPIVPVVLAASFGVGFTMALVNLVWTNTVQEMVPREALGRVFSIDALGSFALLPLGSGLAGWATDLVGPPLVFIVGGFLTALLAALGLLHPGVRNLD